MLHLSHEHESKSLGQEAAGKMEYKPAFCQMTPWQADQADQSAHDEGHQADALQTGEIYFPAQKNRQQAKAVQGSSQHLSPGPGWYVRRPPKLLILFINLLSQGGNELSHGIRVPTAPPLQDLTVCEYV